MMLDSYLTVNQEGSSELMIQKSRFIGYVRRTETEEAAQQFIESIKKKHYDATHNCSAYIIGQHDQIQKANDDGEPSGTAGIPILEVLKKQQLKHTAVVITRYFGGIKLGAGGLIRAYGKATSQAIQATGIIKRQLVQGFTVTVDYTHMGKLENELRNSDYILQATDYQEQVSFFVYVKNGEEDTIKKWMTDLTNAEAHIKTCDQTYIDINITSPSK